MNTLLLDKYIHEAYDAFCLETNVDKKKMHKRHLNKLKAFKQASKEYKHSVGLLLLGE